MRHKDIVTLITVTYTTDALGNQVADESKKEIFANMFTVSATEFYNAALTGLRPSLMFEIYSFEYAGQTRLEYEGKKYNIIRVTTAGEKTRLVCEEVAGV
jgi:SPP1 family predicted phage head-tail adaptor